MVWRQGAAHNGCMPDLHALTAQDLRALDPEAMARLAEGGTLQRRQHAMYKGGRSY